MQQHLIVLSLMVVAAGGAQAAPLERPVPTTPGSRACQPGFSALPATHTCIRISGRVRSEVAAGTPLSRASDPMGLRSEGRLQLDSRTTTEYGPLRAVIRIDGRSR